MWVKWVAVLFYFIAVLFYFTCAAGFIGGIMVENQADWTSSR